MRKVLIVASVLIAVAVAACSGGGGDGGTSGGGNVNNGRTVFTGTGACITCHTIQGVAGATGIIGPELTHIGTVAANRKPGMAAEAYIRESILTPSAFVVPTYPDGQMPTDLGTRLSAQQQADLVAFLLSLN